MAEAYRVLVGRAPETEDFGIAGSLPDGRPVEHADVSFVSDHILSGVTEYQPKILILDADSESVDAFAVTKTISIQHPETSVIIISRNEQPDFLRRAMLAGAEEYLIKPVDGVSAFQAICDVAEIQRQKQAARSVPPPETRKSEVIAITSGKGGVGKTTLAVNLAIALSQMGKKVVLLGLESGDAGVLMSLTPKVGVIDLLSMNDEMDASMLESCVMNHKSGVSFLTASIRYSGHSLELIKSEYAVGVIEMLKETRDCVIVDLPLLLHAEDLKILDLAHQILVVTSSWDLLVLRNTRTFLDSIPENVRSHVKVILNRADRRDMIQEEDVRKSLQTEIAAIVANDSKLAPNSINIGVPLVVSHPASEISQDILQLARLLSGEEQVEIREEKKKKFKFFS